MLFPEHVVLLRGGGDLGTGVAYRLHRAGFPLIVLELEQPLTVRRTVALSTAVTQDAVIVEDLHAHRVESVLEAQEAAEDGAIPVLVSPVLPFIGASVVVDARLAKRNIDTRIEDAPLVIALGPGFTAGRDCHAVVETKRGHRLGRVLWEGSAAPDTGVPGAVGGRSAGRVFRAPRSGITGWGVAIGDRVEAGDVLGDVGGEPVRARLEGIVRGLIAPGIEVREGIKLGDIDPRGDPTACYQISDKALAVGGGVLEAVLAWLNAR